jgi:hypothetical protein
MNIIYLTIHNVGNERYRFYVPSIFSKSIFKKRKQQVIIKIGDLEFRTHTTCGPIDYDKPLLPKQKKGYDLYSLEISNWIERNKEKRGTKIDFYFKFDGSFIVLIMK